MKLLKKAMMGLLFLSLVSGVAYLVVNNLKEKSFGGSAISEIINQGLVQDVTGNSGNLTSSTYTITLPFGVSGFRTGSFQFTGLANATIDIFMSDFNSSNFSLSAPTGTRIFTDISTDLIGAASFNSDRVIFVDTPIIASYLRFVITTSTSATSTWRLDSTLSSQ